VKSGEEDTKAVELVLIRRRGGGEEGGHHGGVWKIAYADFMTAMMAFFLVMWLINSTDQKVLTQVANYFNPMRLTDNTPREKGVQDVESGDQGKQGKQSMPTEAKEKKPKKTPPERVGESSSAKDADVKHDKKDTTAAAGEARYTEQALFNDPYGILARIAADAPKDMVPNASLPGSHQFKDPFGTNAQQKALPDAVPATPSVVADPKVAAAKRPAEKENAAEAATKGQRDGRATIEGEAIALGDQGGPADATMKGPTERRTKLEGEASAQTDRGSVAEAGPKEQILEQPPGQTSDKGAPATKQDVAAREQAAVREALAELERDAQAKAAAEHAAAVAEADQISTHLKDLVSQMRGLVPNIDVAVTEEGVLISLTDGTDFGMFAIASAEPRPAMVVVMEKIAKVVKGFEHPIIVRGHTDGRPYRSGTYDNWRLSTARAHMAYYMLVRGGVDEKRFEKIEGHAARQLRIPNDPEAAQNRRIEILLRRART
jgi:chemotaxis protein MotB